MKNSVAMLAAHHWEEQVPKALDVRRRHWTPEPAPHFDTLESQAL